MTKISVWVQSDKGRFQPGTAVVYIDGKVHARLRGEEGYEITVSEPQVSTSLKQPTVELSGAAAEADDRAMIRCVHCGAEVWWPLPRPDDPCYECKRPVGQREEPPRPSEATEATEPPETFRLTRTPSRTRPSERGAD